MECKYQIIILGSIIECVNEIIDLLYKSIQDLNLQKDFYKVIYSQEVEEKYKGYQPTFVIYFGDRDGNFKDLKVVEKLLEGGNIILPIYFNSFKKEIPVILKNQNGLLYEVTCHSKIVNLILESFGKLRNTRKVFISYRRQESTSVAIQCYEALEKNNFDVFLDTHSIKPGEAFQDELWHRMTDCDVIVMLNTTNFLESEWCAKEVAEASVKQIGILQLIWPNTKLSSSAELCFPYLLQSEDFENSVFEDKDLSKIKENTLKNIVEKVESIRVRNLAARQDNIISDFLNLAKKHGHKVSIQPERFITEDLTKNKRRIFIPSIGIPQSMDYNQSSILKKEIRDFSVDEVFLIYDNIRIRNNWLRHLEYLNNYLDVKSLKKQEFDQWLQEH